MVVPKIKYAKTVGTQILVEILSSKDIIETVLHLEKDKNIHGTPQAYILEIGPMVKSEYGFSVGDRVVLQGTYTPLPEVTTKNERLLGVCEPHAIKAILIEEDEQ